MSFTHCEARYIQHGGVFTGRKSGERTFSGSDTIMWQSMNIPGTPFATHESTGAPKVVASSVLRDGRDDLWGAHPW